MFVFVCYLQQQGVDADDPRLWDWRQQEVFNSERARQREKVTNWLCLNLGVCFLRSVHPLLYKGSFERPNLLRMHPQPTFQYTNETV